MLRSKARPTAGFMRSVTLHFRACKSTPLALPVHIPAPAPILGVYAGAGICTGLLNRRCADRMMLKNRSRPFSFPHFTFSTSSPLPLCGPGWPSGLPPGHPPVIIPPEIGGDDDGFVVDLC